MDAMMGIDSELPKADICSAFLIHHRIYFTEEHFSEGTAKGSTIG
jgi:hypothetical protein